MFYTGKNRLQIEKIARWNDFPISPTERSKGVHAKSHELKNDELKKDKKGLRNGGGLKKEKRVESKDEETFKWVLIVL